MRKEETGKKRGVSEWERCEKKYKAKDNSSRPRRREGGRED